MTNELRKGLPALPSRMLALPRDERGYPVPWFVKWIDGKPDFRVIDPEKLIRAVRFSRCWICGDQLGSIFAFVSGPLAVVNRASAEPPSHVDCAEFAAHACPFLILPRAKRREAGMPESSAAPAGEMIERNPGVCCVWITRGFSINRSLFRIGDPVEVRWRAQGRDATREEILTGLEGSLDELRKIAEAEGEDSMKALASLVERSVANLPGVPA